MASALVIGGTGFVGRHTAEELLDHGYDVTVLSRRAGDRSTSDRDGLAYHQGDRTDPATLDSVATGVSPDLVIDCAAFHPASVRQATSTFSDVDAYVYVSSGGVYARDDIPKREEVTPLHSYTAADGTDDSLATYGPRKAEADRIATAAAADGVAAMSVRPSMIYGPKSTGLGDAPSPDDVSWVAGFSGIQTHHDYWINRVDMYDRVVVPGDGTAIWHRAYVEDVAHALRVVAEDGIPGEAYNVADRRVLTMEDVIDLIADTLDTSVEVIHASRRELERVDLAPDDFVLYHHLGHDYPHVLSTCKLSALDWESTPVDKAMERTVEESLASGRDGSTFDPGRAAEKRLIDSLTG